MIPVTQTKVVIKNSKNEIVVHGNCYAAAIASIMELPITEVPNVETLFHIEGGLWNEVMLSFIQSKGWELTTDMRFKIFHPEFNEILKSPDKDRTDEEYTSDMRIMLEDKLYLVSGPSPRGVSHVCIYKAGELLHDPHPTREGLLSHKYFETLEIVK